MKVLIVTNTDDIKINHIVDSFKSRSDTVITVIHQYTSSIQLSIKEKIRFKLKIPSDRDNLNKRILQTYSEFAPEMVFIIKGNIVHSQTLKKLKHINPNIILVSWSLDDMYAWHNRSIFYTLSLAYYDHVFTTKSYNVEELKQLGAKKVHFIYQAYSKKYHMPCQNCSATKYDYDVLFIGAAEKERVASLTYLAERGIKIHKYGGWDKKLFPSPHPNIIIHMHDLTGKEYANAISCSKISLCFLRKMNRDLHTSRSIEIPACKAFMLAERTREHLELFDENKEAVYFIDDNELLEKLLYYLKNEEKRICIAKSGYERCLKSKYSYDDMLEKIITTIELA